MAGTENIYCPRSDEADFFGLLAVAVLAARMKAGLEAFLAGLPGPVLRRIFHEWRWQTHCGQEEPPGDWRVWLMMTGRGFGKTLTGAQWVTARARENPGARIALVGGTYREVIDVMIEGPNGLLALARPDEPVRWEPTRAVLTFASGAEARPFSASAPEKLRGPEHDFAWCDELGKWTSAKGSAAGRGAAAWDNLQMGMRRGVKPRTIVTTTPRPVGLMRRVLALPGAVVTRGRTADNFHTAQDYRSATAATYAGTRLGRQELDGILFEDVEGALFPRDMLERARIPLPGRQGSGMGSAAAGSYSEAGSPASLAYPPPFPPCQGGEFFKRTVVGVDPPASADGDACGIVVCALGQDNVAYVLADCSVAGLRPEGWARAVARAAAAWGADRGVAEKNQGGDMVESVLRNVEPGLPVKPVSASRGKVARAEPVAAAFETGRAKLAGCFPELEDELSGMTVGGGYEGPGHSPDRADAMVWAMTELIRPHRGPPRIRPL